MMNFQQSTSKSEQDSKPNYSIPTHLVQPMWLRGRESMMDDGLIYDPIAANACRYCHLSSDCLSGDINQKQLLHATMSKLCDERVKAFLSKHPRAWILNIGAALDTRFYRLDNGLCHWVELDISENLVWRKKLFHSSERYQLRCGSVDTTDWLDTVAIPSNVPILIVCEQALLDREERDVARFVQMLGRSFSNAQACISVAGDKASSRLGKKLGSQSYAHGLKEPAEKIQQWLPWCRYVKLLSPFDDDCGRWKIWQKTLAKLPVIRNRLTPIILEFAW